MSSQVFRTKDQEIKVATETPKERGVDTTRLVSTRNPTAATTTTIEPMEIPTTRIHHHRLERAT